MYECRLFLWQLGESYKKEHHYDDAVRIFSQIAQSFEHDTEDDGSGQLRCWWKLAVLSQTVGNVEASEYYCTKILELGERKSLYERQKERIAGARLMLDSININ